MTTPFRSIPAAVLAGASAVLGGAARIAMFGARTLDPRWRRDAPPADQPLPTPDLPAPGAGDPDADRDLASLTGVDAGAGEGSAVVEDLDVDGDGVPDAVVVVVDDDGDGVADGAMAASVVDTDGDGEPDAVVAVLDVDGDGVVDDVLVVTAEEAAGGDTTPEDAALDDAGAALDDAGAALGEAAFEAMDLGADDAAFEAAGAGADEAAGGVLAASVVDGDGDGEPDAVVALLDVDGDGIADDVLVVTGEDEEGGDAASADAALAGAPATKDLTGAGEGTALADDDLADDDLTDDGLAAASGDAGGGEALEEALATDDLTGAAEGAPAGADLSSSGVDLGAAAGTGAEALMGTGAGPEVDADAAADAGTVAGMAARPSGAPTADAGPAEADADADTAAYVTDDDGEVDVYAAEHADDAPVGEAALIDAEEALTEPMGAETPPADPVAPPDAAGEDGFAVAAGDEDLLGGDLAPAPVVDDVPTQEHRDDQGTDDTDDDHARRPESHVAEIAERPVATVLREIATLSTDELGALFEYESTHRKRKTVLQAIERATAPQAD